MFVVCALSGRYLATARALEIPLDVPWDSEDLGDFIHCLRVPGARLVAHPEHGPCVTCVDKEGFFSVYSFVLGHGSLRSWSPRVAPAVKKDYDELPELELPKVGSEVVLVQTNLEAPEQTNEVWAWPPNDFYDFQTFIDERLRPDEWFIHCTPTSFTMHPIEIQSLEDY